MDNAESEDNLFNNASVASDLYLFVGQHLDEVMTVTLTYELL